MNSALLRLLRWLAGYVDVAVTGPRPEELVNQAALSGMDVWDLRRAPDRVEGRLLLADFRLVRPLARRTRCRVRIRRRRGLPFALRRLGRRQGLVAGALACAAALAWFGSHVWTVAVRGTVQVDPRAVRAALADLGLRPGVSRWRPDLAAIEAGLPRLVPSLGWATVRLEGTRAVVEVVEQSTVRPPPPRGRVDIVADRDNCLVEEVVTLQGRAAVAPNQAVRPGQVLIEGVRYTFDQPPMRLPYMSDRDWPPVPTVPVTAVQAQGVIRARCFYARTLTVPLYTEEQVPTGRQVVRVVLRVAGREILIKGPRSVPFAAYTATVQSLAPPAVTRNWLPPVEVRTETCAEVVVRRIPRDGTGAREEAVQEFRRQVERALKPEVDRVVRHWYQDAATAPDQVVLRVFAETREQIGRPQPVPEALPAPPPLRPQP